MNQILKLKELIGKTIVQICNQNGELYIKFTDNSFVVLEVKDITEGFGYTKNEVNISDYTTKKTNTALITLGLITKKEHDLAVEEEENEYKKWIDERDRLEAERVKEIEMKQLQNLKDKYKL